MKKHHVAQLDEIPPVPCPCGLARRAFAEVRDAPASVHLVDIRADAERHFHTAHTEIYLVLEGEGHIEIDNQLVPVRPMSVVMIPPFCRHRAIGQLRLINIVTPPFDPNDEFTDDQDPTAP